MSLINPTDKNADQIPPDLAANALRANAMVYLAANAIDQALGAAGYAMRNPAMLVAVVNVLADMNAKRTAQP